MDDPPANREPSPARRPVGRPDVAAAALALLLVACGDATGPEASRNCSIPETELFDGGVGFNGIPALVDPSTSRPDGSHLGFLQDTSRVVGVQLEGRTIAVPLNVLWWHEVVNFDLGDRQIAVTDCPLTGSTLVFDREAVDGRPFFVSGLLWRNNLIMTTEEGGASLFMQMAREAKCGPDRGTELTMVPSLETTWAAWRAMHPETEVVNADTDFDRDYTRYPYGDYRDLGNSTTLFPAPPHDPRRPPKEKLLGIPDGDGGIAFPFLELEAAGPTTVVRTRVRGQDVVVFWKTEARGAAAFRPVVAEGPGQGDRLTFEVRDGEIVDAETEGVWRLDGRAVEGSLAGARLEPVAEAYPAFWFAWDTFQPDAEIWTADGS